MRIALLIGVLILCVINRASAQSAPSWVEPAWTTVIDGTPKSATRFAIAATEADGPVYVTGTAFTPSSPSTSMGLWRLDPDGSVRWMISIAPPGSTECYGVAIVQDVKIGHAGWTGHVYVTGVVAGSNGLDILTSCYYDTYDDDQNVTLVWQHRYNNSQYNANDDDVPVAMKLDASEEMLFVGGNSVGANPWSQALGNDMVVIKYPALNGSTPSWVTRWNGVSSGEDRLADLKPVSLVTGATAYESVALFVAGTSWNGVSKNDFVTLKIDMADGSVDATNVFNFAGAGADVAASIDAFAVSLPEGGVAGGVFVTGCSNGTGTGDNDYLTVAYPIDLSQAAWVRTYDGPGEASDKAVKVVYHPDDGGTVFVTGESYGGSSEGYDFATTRYDALDGSNAWSVSNGVMRFDNPNGHGEDRPTELVVDSDGNSYVGGKSYNGSTLDFAAVSYQIDGATRWTRHVGTTCYPNDYYVTYNGSANGPDIAVALAVTGFGGVLDPLGDVFLFGTVTATVGQTTVQKHAVAKWTQIGADPCP